MDEQARRLHLHDHVGDGCLYQLELCYRASELATFLYVVGRAVQSRLADGEGHRGVAEPLDGERGEQLREAAFVHQQVLTGNPHLVEEHVGRTDAAEAHQPFLRSELETGGVPVDDHGADPPRAKFLPEAHVDQILLRVSGPRAPSLHAVDHDLVAVHPRPGGHVGGGRAGIRLGDRDRYGALAAANRRKPAALLLGSSEHIYHAGGTGGGFEDRPGGHLGCLGQLFDDDEGVDQRPAHPAVLLGKGYTEESEFAEALPLFAGEVDAGRVPFLGAGRVHIARQVSCQGAELALLLGQGERALWSR